MEGFDALTTRLPGSKGGNMNKGRGRLARYFFLALTIAALVILVIVLSDIVKTIVIAALLAYIADPAAAFLESRLVSRRAATLLIFLFLLLGTALCFFLLVPALGREIAALRAGFDSGEAVATISRIERTLEDSLGFLGVRNLDLVNRTQKAMVSVSDWMFSHLLDMVSLFTNLVIIPFIVFFLLKDGREIKKRLVHMVPNRYFEFTLYMLHKMDLQLGNYLRGQFMDALIFGALSMVSLWLLHVKYFVAIGLFAGLANLIPFLGPVAGAAPAVIIAVIDSGNLMQAVYVLLAFAAMKLIDDSLIQPIVVARSVDMHPLVVLMAVIVGGRLFGILGMLLAVPAVGFLKVVLSEGVATFRKYQWADT